MIDTEWVELQDLVSDEIPDDEAPNSNGKNEISPLASPSRRHHLPLPSHHQKEDYLYILHHEEEEEEEASWATSSTMKERYAALSNYGSVNSIGEGEPAPRKFPKKGGAARTNHHGKSKKTAKYKPQLIIKYDLS